MEFSASTPAPPAPYVERRPVASDITFVRQVFAWMLGGLVVTGVVSAVLTNTLSHELLTNTGMPLFIAALVLELVVVFGVSFGINRISAGERSDESGCQLHAWALND